MTEQDQQPGADGALDEDYDYDPQPDDDDDDDAEGDGVSEGPE